MTSNISLAYDAGHTLDDASMLDIVEEYKSAAKLFGELAATGPKVQKKNLGLIVVSHILPDKLAFLEMLNKHFGISAIVPKPKSIDKETHNLIKSKYRFLHLQREELSDFGRHLPLFKEALGARRFVVLDVGGYFAPNVENLSKTFGSQFLGVVEDTENGHARYMGMKDVSVPILSVARSPLKEPEDYLIGQSILFSAEAVLRGNNQILMNKKALVIGYGKIGKSIALSLANRNVDVKVYDHDPIRMAQALSHGFDVSDKRELATSDIVFCATGNKSLCNGDFSTLKKGAYVASVTSSDDEFDLSNLRHRYFSTPVNPTINKYYRDNHYFYLINEGNAVNFLHKASVGSYIHLVQAEIFAASAKIAAGNAQNGFGELSSPERKRIAGVWLKNFSGRKLQF